MCFDNKIFENRKYNKFKFLTEKYLHLYKNYRLYSTRFFEKFLTSK